MFFFICLDLIERLFGDGAMCSIFNKHKFFLFQDLLRKITVYLSSHMVLMVIGDEKATSGYTTERCS